MMLLPIFALHLLLTSLLTDACQDGLVECATTLANKCFASIVQRHCPRTCNICAADPCYTDNGGCEQLCNGTSGVAVCSCTEGFRLANDSKSCKDINECTEGPNPCFFALPQFCINTVGSYSCQDYSCTSVEPGSMNYYRSNNCCQLRNSSCGLTKSINTSLVAMNAPPTFRRVFGGLNAAVSTWPWQVEILYRGGAHCGATLISDRWLLSAAHCFSDSDYRLMLIYVGQVRSELLDSVDSSSRQQRRIAAVTIHPENNNRYGNDIAVVELAEPVEINSVVRPICLPCGEVPRSGDKCWTTGFGRTDPLDYETAKILQEVDVPIVNTSTCVEAYKGHHEIDEDTMLCAGYSEGGKDACLGDSGGPLACQRSDSCEWYIAGITSFGRGCGLSGYYGVYVNVIHFEEWIRRTTRNAVGSCQKQYNPCRGHSNVLGDCYSRLQDCKRFPHFMGKNCKLACCQFQNGEISDCFDDAGYEETCSKFAQYCSHSLFKTYLHKHCKKTCQACTK